MEGKTEPAKQLPYEALAAGEERVLSFWKTHEVFAKSVARRKRKKRFVFYEGPPYANGKPGLHHVLARAFKDAILRYKTMRGFFVERRAGWDTHGLPTEVEVEKLLGIRSKKDIERMGIGRFVEEARKNVFLYKDEWERLTERMGYWIDLARAYVTMDAAYMESLWWILATLFHKKRLYREEKVVPWCPRCETALSSFEVAQGYANVTEEAIYVKFPLADNPKTAFVVWTTTPWTLPGNVALAIRPTARYATVENAAGERLIVALARAALFDENWRKVAEEDGAVFIGKTYNAPYPDPRAPYRVVGALFVSTEEGTGIVHIAPAFGADDAQVAKTEALPMLVTVDAQGLMRTDGFSWNRMFVKDADPMIREELASRGLLFRKESFRHDYPFCWRCKSPLLYYARMAWWLRTTAVKEQMVAQNKTVRWHPEYLRDGRFGEWLSENVDWNISRERYWGLPLPLWECGSCGTITAVESLAALDAKDPSPTTVFLARHGEATSNLSGLITPPRDADAVSQSVLTKRGVQMIERVAKKLKKAHIDVILTSPLRRTRQTAELYSQAWGGVEILVREELREIDTGEFAGKSTVSYHERFPSVASRLEASSGAGEGLRELRRRVVPIADYIGRNYRGKNVLVVSHGDPLWILAAALNGLSEDEYATAWYPKTGEIKSLRLHNWSYGADGVLDLHRPYIDAIRVRCDNCAQEATRVKEVADVWFDSGAMPFAKDHWPFAQMGNQKLKTKNSGEDNAYKLIKKIDFPADYICEGIDQTRGWFYSLLATASLLDFPAPYSRVLSVGLVLDEQGQKMSKSRGNIADPWALFSRYGADAVRWYFFTLNQPWDDKRFAEKDVRDAGQRFLLIAVNALSYWKTYAAQKPAEATPPKTRLALNNWLIAKTHTVVAEVTQCLEAYDMVKAARALEAFMVEDISHWYIRRIRSDMKTPQRAAAKEHAATLGWTLREFAKSLAPFAPFFAEQCFQTVTKNNTASVHWEDWTTDTTRSAAYATVLRDMEAARTIVSKALELRTRAGVKVRQPLAALHVKRKETFAREFVELIKGEVNVKKVVFGAAIAEELALDTALTPELKEEGVLRELARKLQALRKGGGLWPGEEVEARFFADGALRPLFENNGALFAREASIRQMTFSPDAKETGKRLEIDGLDMFIAFAPVQANGV